jgi:hypothetical protein
MASGFLSKAQLQSRTWPTREALVTELKRNGYKPTGDYEPRKYNDSWVVASVFVDDAAQPAPEDDGSQVPPVKAAAAAKSSSARKAATAKKPAPIAATKAAPAKKAAAAPVCSNCQTALTADNSKDGSTLCDECAGRKSNTTLPVIVQLPERPARGVKKSAQKKASDEAKAAANKPTPEPTPPPEEQDPVNDMTALPTVGGPYTLRIGDLASFDIPGQALEVARRLAPNWQLVSIIDKAGKLVRTIDGRIGAPKKAPKQPRSTNSGGGGRTGRSTTPSPILQQAIELAMRPEGVTRAQLREHVTEKLLAWTIMLKDAERFGYVYSTSEATDGKSRTVYHLEPIKA